MSYKSLTVPQEFKFAESRTRKQRESYSFEQNIPLAELVRKLENQTPETWKRVARAPSPVKKLELTVPKPFHFSSSNRRSSIKNKDKLVNATKMFRARPLNRKIFESTGDLGVPRIPKRPLTEPISPKFSTRTRKAEVLPSENLFKRNRKISRERNQLGITVPEPFKLISVEKHIYEQQKLKQKIEEEKEKQRKKKKFKANPLPIVEPFRPVLDLKFTEPEPFHLISSEKSEIEKAKLKEMIQAEKENMLKRTLFKSRPFINKKPLQIKCSNKPLTEIDPNFVLNTDMRAHKRKEFDTHLMEKEAQRQKEEELRMREEEERRKREIKNLRASLTHKPLPVPITLYKPQILKPTLCAPLTEPKTPNFSYKKKKKVMNR